MFRVILHKKAAKAVRDLPPQDRSRILSALREMELDPFSGDIKSLKPLRGMFRRRVGDYRVIFSVDFEHSEVIVFKVSQRERVYKVF